jgi:hypothetical protein
MGLTPLVGLTLFDTMKLNTAVIYCYYYYYSKDLKWLKFKLINAKTLWKKTKNYDKNKLVYWALSCLAITLRREN